MSERRRFGIPPGGGAAILAPARDQTSGEGSGPRRRRSPRTHAAFGEEQTRRSPHLRISHEKKFVRCQIIRDLTAADLDFTEGRGLLDLVL